MEIRSITPSEFPTGRGERLKCNQEFLEFVASVKAMKVESNPKAVIFDDKHRNSAISWRDTLKKALVNRAGMKFEIIVRRDERKVYNLYVRRTA